jgi:hypothetical protein
MHCSRYWFEILTALGLQRSQRLTCCIFKIPGRVEMKKGVAKKATKSVKKGTAKSPTSSKSTVKKATKKKVSRRRKQDPQPTPLPGPRLPSDVVLRDFLCTIPDSLPSTVDSNAVSFKLLPDTRIQVTVGIGKKVYDYGYIVGDLNDGKNFTIDDGEKRTGYINIIGRFRDELTTKEIIDILEDLVITVLVKKKVR